MTQTAAPIAETLSPAILEQQLRARIDSLSYLPTAVTVAMKFIELGKDPDAEPADYAKVIGADSSLSAKLLALANSPWFGVRNNVTTVKHAVNLLGLGTVRTMATSICMAGLHNELKLKPDESRMFWESSLYKAVAAKRYARGIDPKLADEAFVTGMFQDFALPVMFSVAREAVLTSLQDESGDIAAQLDRERASFGLDHMEVARILAQRLDLPDTYVDAVAFHHDHTRLRELLASEIIADAAHVASLFPHLLDVWRRDDTDALCGFLTEKVGGGPSTAEFLQKVQDEFIEMYRYFEDKEPPENRIADALIQAAREGADNTVQLVKTVNEMMQEVASAGMEVTQLAEKHSSLEQRAAHDPLTGALNRDGFNEEAPERLAKAARYRVGYALVYMDIDGFKQINDRLGHEAGDRALRGLVAKTEQGVRKQDLVGRLGGDEFVVLLDDCTESDARGVVKRMLAAVADGPIAEGAPPVHATLSAGLLYVRPTDRQHTLEKLIAAADRLMYAAKRAGGNRVQTHVT